MGKRALAAAVTWLAAVAWVFAGPLFAGRVLYYRDVSVTYFPDFVFVAGALHEGVWPLWHPGADGGAPFLMAYPVHLLLLLAGGPAAALALSPALHVLLAMVGDGRPRPAAGDRPRRRHSRGDRSSACRASCSAPCSTRPSSPRPGRRWPSRCSWPLSRSRRRVGWRHWLSSSRFRSPPSARLRSSRPGSPRSSCCPRFRAGARRWRGCQRWPSPRPSPRRRCWARSPSSTEPSEAAASGPPWGSATRRRCPSSSRRCCPGFSAIPTRSARSASGASRSSPEALPSS